MVSPGRLEKGDRGFDSSDLGTTDDAPGAEVYATHEKEAT